MPVQDREEPDATVRLNLIPVQKFERLEIGGDLQGAVMVYEPVAVSQISEGGMRLQTSAPLHLDSLHDFRLTLGRLTVVVKGRIVHCRLTELEDGQVTYRAGVEFIEPSEHALHAIRGFISGMKARARSAEASR
jgi:hypothetical protein